MARFNITNGPSKWDLMLALFDGDCHHKRMVRFSLKDLKRDPIKDPEIPDLSFVINTLEREDGSGENWNFEGYYPGSSQNGPCQGFFSIRTRTGWIEF